jgi:hypothetical protein
MSDWCEGLIVGLIVGILIAAPISGVITEGVCHRQAVANGAAEYYVSKGGWTQWRWITTPAKRTAEAGDAGQQ